MIQKCMTAEMLTAASFREFIAKNWTRAQILTILKRTVIQTYNSAKKPCLGLLCANYVV